MEVWILRFLTKDIWDGHPCCAFGTSEEFIKKNISYDKPFDEVYKNAYSNCLVIYGCGSDNLTNEIIFEFIISEFECSLLEE